MDSEGQKRANINAQPVVQPQPQNPSNGFEIPFLKSANNPGVCFFHVIFKITGILFYLILNFFINTEIATFIIIMIINAMDFWVVKNVIGR